ncbi:putative C2H2-type domain-containing protein [Seiridium cardinale]
MASIAEQSYHMFPRPSGDQDFLLYAEHQPAPGYASPPMDGQYSPEGFGFPHTSGFEANPMYAEAPHMTYNGRASPGVYPEDGELRVPSSNMSTTSASSSNMGSPHSNPGQLAYVPEYTHNPLGVNPSIVGHGDYYASTEYTSYVPQVMEGYDMTYTDSKPGFVDPSLIHPEIRGPMGPPMQGYDNSTFSPQNHPYPNSPALSGATSPVPGMRNGSASPYVPGFQYSPFAVPQQDGRRPSMSSFQSPQEYSYSGDESKEKQRCPHPDCGKTFKDLKAHMLTHQTERPEKCPIQTCDYHVKGFARKYDKNRHTLTHYKGTMVCGFCPGSGSAAEKSFNRADVFKRHLTAVHGVEQTPPNSRKKTSASVNSGKKLTGYAADATGKCSTCSVTFSNAQDFYEHLDDCVLRIVQQEDPAEAVNARRLAEVENDEEVHQTLEKNSLPLTTQTNSLSDEEDDDDMVDDDDFLDEDFKARKASPRNKKGNPANGVQKSRGLTHSRGGVSLNSKSKSRKNHRDYPSSWGFDKGQMTMKKRVMTVFDGPRRLAKDDMMLSTEHEVRIKLADGKSYVTDLDVQTMKRAQGFLDATDEEKGIWVSDDPTEDDMRKMLELASQ